MILVYVGYGLAFQLIVEASPSISLPICTHIWLFTVIIVPINSNVKKMYFVFFIIKTLMFHQIDF